MATLPVGIGPFQIPFGIVPITVYKDSEIRYRVAVVSLCVVCEASPIISAIAIEAECFRQLCKSLFAAALDMMTIIATATAEVSLLFRRIPSV